MVRDNISIAVATYNGGKYLRDQLESLVNQSTRANEIIVCDDGSTDDTLSILAEYENKGLLKFFVNEHSLGVKKNFEQAVTKCTGQYIALCDQDDVWHPTKLQFSIEKMKQIEYERLPCLVYTDLEIVDQKLNMIEHSFWKYLRVHPEKESFHTLLYGNTITGCTVLLNSAFKHYIKNIPNSASMHDAWVGLIAFGLGKTGAVTESTVKYRRHDKNITSVVGISAFGRLVRTLSLIIKEIKNPSFLELELSQAELFLEAYGSLLTLDKLDDLNKFLVNRDQGFLIRKTKAYIAKRLPNIFNLLMKNSI
ncbi:glycosyltransferase family 2 protein [Methyloglobulus sp.]|uniref:glycosyltransferase family 2 protein n=1 Tax=Methyloglobulus sp. TaxID=2518622 RepID=UPI0032B759AF